MEKINVSEKQIVHDLCEMYPDLLQEAKRHPTTGTMDFLYACDIILNYYKKNQHNDWRGQECHKCHKGDRHEHHHH